MSKDQTQEEEAMIIEANRYNLIYSNAMYDLKVIAVSLKPWSFLAVICRYALASHFLWGLWSIIQAKISKIEFGYMVRNFILFHITKQTPVAWYIYFNKHNDFLSVTYLMLHL